MPLLTSHHATARPGDDVAPGTSRADTLVCGPRVRRLCGCPSRIRCQAATGSWTKSRQWEIQRTLFSSAQAPRNVASTLDSARELGIRDAQVCQARSSGSERYTRARPHAVAPMNCVPEDSRRRSTCTGRTHSPRALADGNRRWCTTLRLRRGSCRLSGHGDRCGCTIST